MNEFVEQFLIESREYVEHATADLLALEKSPDDRARLDSAFRAFHTLKGSAGIVDFTAMADAVHAAEEVLSEARIGVRAMTSVSVGDCLACLDQVIQWLNAMEGTGEVPEQGSSEAAAIVARFARSAGGNPPTVLVDASPAPESWVKDLKAITAAVGVPARTAVRYVPEAECFYHGEDPLTRIAGLPGLLAMDGDPVSPWLSIDALDPFACNLVLTALSSSARPEVAAAMAGVESRYEIRDVAVDRPPGEGQMSGQACEILQAQIQLLAKPGANGGVGRVASAGIVAANVLRYEGRSSEADRVTRALQSTYAENDPRTLREAIELAMHEVTSAVVAPSTTGASSVTARTLRIDAARIDALVNLTGELTVAKNAIGHATKLAEDGDPALASTLKERYATLDHLVGELQQSVLKMRVLPLSQAFQRLPRLLREMSNDLGKPARLVVEGADTEADKAIVEMLFEPLLHVLRNAMDHGVEDAATRAAHRKPPAATIRLHADRHGEHVIVEVSDDGAGIDVTRIRQLVRDRKVISEEALTAMDDQAITEMIFAPGFSTVKEVTGLSGRGVGMDAVRAAVGRLGGHVGVESRAGHGTTVRFTLPFSVMLTRVVIVSAGHQSFGIPLNAVVETLRIDADRIIQIGAAYATVLRDRTVPVVPLAEVLGFPQVEQRSDEVTLVVTRVNGLYGALRVDRIGARMEVMLKPLDGLLTQMRGVAGSALLGDGTVLLVLDIGELFR